MPIPTPLCQICCIPFVVGRIKKFNDEFDTAIDFNAPGDRRRLDGFSRGGSPIDQRHEDELAKLAAAKMEECMEDLLGGDEVCRWGKGCRQIGIAVEGDPLGHFAGAGCNSNAAYGGFKITHDEMEERTRLCCLRAKPEVWFDNAAVDATHYEATLCYLVEDAGWTNLSNESQAKVPLEHQADLPMHPSCYATFKRRSLQRSGKVDIDALWLFRERYGNWHNGLHPKEAWAHDSPQTWTRFDGFPQPTDLGIVLRDEVWSRINVKWESRYLAEPGTEYLAADPVNVPGLDELISAGSQGRVSDIAFSSPRAPAQTQDILSSLPAEIRKLIVEVLPRKDLINLRIACSSFTELPQSYFRHLIKAEMPWVWEIDPVAPEEVNWLGLWYKLAAADGGSYVDEKKRVWARQQLYNLPGRWELVSGRHECKGTMEQPSYGAVDEAKEHIMKQFRVLNKMRYWGDDKKATELKGLRNRRRIWGDVEGILDRGEEIRLRGEVL